MAYGDAISPTNITNATLIQNIHPLHHNDMATRINEIMTELGSKPSAAIQLYMFTHYR